MTTQPNALKLAKQGDAKAIAALMNQPLQRKGITARVGFSNGCLWVILEGDRVPDQTVMVRFIEIGVSRLEIASLKSLKIYGRQAGQTYPDWSQELSFNPSSIDPDSGLNSSTFQNFSPSDYADPVDRVQAATPISPPQPKSNHAHFSSITASQRRLMSLLRVLATIATLVALGSFIQAFKQFDRLFHQVLANPSALIGILGSSAITLLGIVAIGVLFRRNGSSLHSKYAKRAYTRLGFALFINLALRLMLMTAITTGILMPRSMVILPLFLTCVMLWVIGCCALAKAKGYHPLWGTLGVFLLDGVLLLSLFPDKSGIDRSM
ncbi:MAG: hypothetical protein HC865_23925 [Cyanobacteria bacterium RU_5_0]|nr:hypothetical protein [Cyanobacteria bacterium RU_5_0]